MATPVRHRSTSRPSSGRLRIGAKRFPLLGHVIGCGANAFFGWLAMFAAHDMPALSAQSRAELGWRPSGPGLIADLERLHVS
jgi:hypothetical protein